MSKLRVREEERKILKRVQHINEVREMAVEEGLLEEFEGDLSYEKILRLIIPDDAEVISRPEEDMAWIPADDMRDEVQRLAGENISAHHVVREFTHDFLEENGIEVEIDE